MLEKIQVQKILCGFMPSNIEISQEKNIGNIFLNFGDIECLELPIKVQGALFIKISPTQLTRLV